MNIIYISPTGSSNPHLFPTFKQTFAEQGHTKTTNPYEATHCFFDTLSGVISYDQNTLNVILERRIPIVCFVHKEFGEMQKDTWFFYRSEEKDGQDDKFLRNAIAANIPIIYFIRNMTEGDLYPNNSYPFDWAYFANHDFPMTTKEELLSRPYDCCFTGTESPTRESIINAIVKDGRLKIHWALRDHTQRIPYDKWIDEHRKAKFFISCDGGGITNERPQQLFSVAAMLKNKNKHIAANQFTDGINCLEINTNPTEDDIDKIIDIIQDGDWLYDIYVTGVKFVKENLSQEAVANYVLKTINNEW